MNAKPARISTRLAALAASLVALAGTSQARAGLTINATFDASVTGNANSAILQADINKAIGIYSNLFRDNVTISIDFRYANTGPNGAVLGSNSLAQSNYTIYTRSYGSFITALTDDKTTGNDATALANLPATDPASHVVYTSANGRALGFASAGLMNGTGQVNTGGTFDGIVTINSAANFQLDRTGGIASGKYDVMQSIEHEIDEVLGLGSILPSTTDFQGNTAIKPEDLYRYSAPGTRSLSTAAPSSYFSIDGGTTNLASFNQASGGDYGDWGPSPGPLVQLAFSSRGTQSDVSATSPEGVALDVIGYDLNTVPEPASMAMLGVGVLIAAGFARRRRRA